MLVFVGPGPGRIAGKRAGGGSVFSLPYLVTGEHLTGSPMPTDPKSSYLKPLFSLFRVGTLALI